MIRHILSQINSETKTGICSVCGLIKIVKHSSTQWRCSTKSVQRNKIRRLKKSNISREEYNQFIQISPPNSHQICGICKKTVQENGKYLALDHCHKTGKIRGYLCHDCNLGIGNFKDDPNLLESAVTYLKN